MTDEEVGKKWRWLMGQPNQKQVFIADCLALIDKLVEERAAFNRLLDNGEIPQTTGGQTGMNLINRHSYWLEQARRDFGLPEDK